MDLSLKDYMECVSLSLTGKPLDFYAFSRRVVFNGGYDMHEISVGDIVHLYNGYLNNYDKIIEMLYFFHQRIDSGMSMLLFAMCFPNPPEYPGMASCRLEKSKRKKNPCPLGVSARTARQAPRHAHENAKGDRYGHPVQRQP